MRTNHNIPEHSSRMQDNDILAEVLDRLPAFDRDVRLRGETGFYGASTLIARQLEMAYPRPSATRWIHGWSHAINRPASALVGDLGSGECVLYGGENQGNILRDGGYTNTHRVGLPYVYADRPELEVIEGSLLVCPRHASNFSSQNWTDVSRKYAEYIASIRDRFSQVVLCVTANCIEAGEWINEFDEVHIPWVMGASIFDQNAYPRMRTLFSSFEFMTTNTIGSHIAYAASEGCKVSICQWTSFRDITNVKAEPLYKQFPELLEATAETGVEAWPRSQYPHLFADSPELAKESKTWGRSQIGSDFRRPAGEIAKLLGWPDMTVRIGQWELSRSGHHAGEIEERNDCVLRSIGFALESGGLDSAGAWIRELKATGFSSVQLEILRIRFFIRSQKYSHALEAAKETARLFPTDPDAQFYLDAVLAMSPFEACPPVKPGDEDFKEIYLIVRGTTILSGARLYHLYRMAKKVCVDDIPGNFAECGVAGGGATLLLALVIKRYSKRERLVFAFDTFEGMPSPGVHDLMSGGVTAQESDWSTATYRGPFAFVEASMQKHGVGESVVCVPGLFSETLDGQRGRIDSLALLHVDGNWYESVKASFEVFYDLLEEYGFVHIGSYGVWDGCTKAVDEFMEENLISYPLVKIQNEAVWFAKRVPSAAGGSPKIGDPLIHEIVEKTTPELCKIPALLNPNERYQVATVIKNALPVNRNHVLVDLDAWAGNNLYLFHLTAGTLSEKSLLIGAEDDPDPLLQAVVSKLGESHCRFLKGGRSEVLSALEISLAHASARPDLIFIRLDRLNAESLSDLKRSYELLFAGGVLIIQFTACSGGATLNEALSAEGVSGELLSIPVYDDSDFEGADTLDPVLSMEASRLSLIRKR